MNGQNQTEIVAVAVTQASGLTTTLHLLKDGRVKQALELLEFTLDSNIVWLDQLLQEVSEPDRKVIKETLESIRDYRQLYPHRPEVNIDWMKEESVASVREIQRRAQTILESLERP